MTNEYVVVDEYEEQNRPPKMDEFFPEAIKTVRYFTHNPIPERLNRFNLRG